jgi:hypothetical protein
VLLTEEAGETSDGGAASGCAVRFAGPGEGYLSGEGGLGAREIFGGGPVSSRQRRWRSALLSSVFGGTFGSSFDIATA